MVKSTDKALTIERNHIQPMAAIEFFPTYPIGNEIFYTATEKVTPHRLDYIDATFISSSWDAETGFGVMLFDGNITKLGHEAFSWRSALTSVIIPDSVTTIGEWAFSCCDLLTSVTIGNGVTTIGGWAFSYCYSLESVYCKPTTPPAGDYTMFDWNASERKIYVPMESVKAYKSASVWSYYADAIVGYDF